MASEPGAEPREDEHRRPQSFFTSLQGLLTAGATFITAVVALLSFFFGKPAGHDATPDPGAARPPVEAPAPARAAGPLNLDDCKAIVGTWDWFIGGTVTIGADGSLGWRARAQDAAPTGVGRWTCMGAGAKPAALTWQTGMTDTVTLSPDGRSLSGANQIGVTVSGTRRPSG